MISNKLERHLFYVPQTIQHFESYIRPTFLHTKQLHMLYAMPTWNIRNAAHELY